ncbi:MAG: fumarylacetoacetate hydrolase family protein [Microbacterium sp.]
MSAENIISAAERLISAQMSGLPCAPVRDLVHDTDSAYAVQQEVVRRRLTAGAVLAGRKIGLTSRVVQDQFGVETPDFGALFSDMIHPDGVELDLGGFLQPRVEGEIAFVLRKELPSPSTTIIDVLRATDFILPAFEIVDSRIRDWDIRITDTIADNASSGAVVLGTTPFDLRGRDLTRVGMVIEHGGEPVSMGAGSACLGSPVTAVAWLAREVARRGNPLRAGEVVMSGALGSMVPAHSPGRYRLRLTGLGDVDVTFTREDTHS